MKKDEQRIKDLEKRVEDLERRMDAVGHFCESINDAVDGLRNGFLKFIDVFNNR